jgi:ABC-type transport system involved in cytochrome c biogenesis ATPase subunit
MAVALISEERKDPFLFLDKVTFHQDWQVILHEINLIIFPQQWVILRGANGCGKTTLLKLCVGLLTPTRGKVFLQGTYRYLGHQNAIKSNQTLIRFKGSLKEKIHQDQVDHLIEFLDLNPYVEIPFYQLSKGLKRRMALVQLFTFLVDLYIIDEPLDNLDSVSCQRIWQLFARKIEEGSALLMTHHDSKLAPHPAIYEIFMDG